MSIKVKTLDKAVTEAKRFLEAAAAVKSAARIDRWAVYDGGHRTAAVKRASMDLTRALADVRRGRQ